jgi:hypothetical protein
VWSQQGFCYLLVEGHQSCFIAKKIWKPLPCEHFCNQLGIRAII